MTGLDDLRVISVGGTITVVGISLGLKCTFDKFVLIVAVFFSRLYSVTIMLQ